MSYTNFKNFNNSQKGGKDRKPPSKLGPMRDKNNKSRYSPYSSSKQSQQQKPPAPVPTVFVGNLAPDITEDILADIFSDCGEMKEVRLKRHADTGKVKGFGFVDFYQMSCAYKAIETKNGVVVLGRPLQVELSNSRQQDKSTDQKRTNIKASVPSQPLQTPNVPKQPNIASQPLPLLTPFQTPQTLLNHNIPVSLYPPTTNPTLPINPSQSSFPQKSIRQDSDYISKRSSDRVEQPQRERPPGCKTVFIGNLLNDVKEEDIREVFRGCAIKEVRWLYDNKGGTKIFKGCGFVDFEDEESTIKAAQLNGCLVLGRPMRVDYASDSKKAKSKDERHHHAQQQQPYIPTTPYLSQPQTSQQTHTPQSYNAQIYNGSFIPTGLAPTQYIPTPNPLPQTTTSLPTGQLPQTAQHLQTQPTLIPSQQSIPTHIPSQQNISQSYIPQSYYQ